MPKQGFSTFWHGLELSPLHRTCLSSFVERGHRMRVFSYRDIEVPDGVDTADARQVIAESELFEFGGSFSAFSNVFRYALLFERESWWVDTDVYCLADDIPDCRYSWARESDDFINGAILKFPVGDPMLERILSAARAIGPNVQIQGQLGPRLLTEHLFGGDFRGHFGSTREFYPVHWLEAHRFWTPDDCPFVLSRIATSTFVHLWATMFRHFGMDERVAPPRGSFLHHLFEHGSCLAAMSPLDEEGKQRTLASIRSFLSAESMREMSRRLLGYDVSRVRVHEEASPNASSSCSDLR